MPDRSRAPVRMMDPTATAVAMTQVSRTGGHATFGRQLGREAAWALVDVVSARDSAERVALSVMGALVLAFERSATHRKPPQERLRDALRAAIDTADVIQRGASGPAPVTHRTSVLVGLLAGDRFIVADVGDANAFRLREGDFALLTGVRCRASRAEAVIHEHSVRAGDLIVLVNDALAWGVRTTEIAELFAHEATPSAVARAMVRLGEAKAKGGAVIALRAGERPA